MINPGEIPQIPGNMEMLAAHATSVKTVGTDFAATGQAVDTTWQGLATPYKAPEAAQLFAATGPVRTTTASVGEDLQAVGAALSTYASEVKEIKAQLASLKTQAEQFLASVKDDDEWREDEGKVNQHNGLISSVNTQVAAFFEAQRKCANTINALYGGKQYRADNLDGKAEDGEYGFTADALNAAAGEDGALPWGSNAEHDRGFWGDVGAFFGGIGEGFVMMLEDLGSLIGRDPETGEWSWGTAGNAWLGLGKFVWAVGIYANPVMIVLDHTTGIPGWEKHGAGNLLLNAGKSIIAYDTWGEDKSKAAGMTTFNVVSAIVGTKGAGSAVRGTGAAVNGIRGSATAVRVGAGLIRVGNWLDNLPTVPEIASNFAKKFNIQIPNFNGLIPEFAGGRPGSGGFHFDVEMPNDRGGNPMNMDGGNGSGNGNGNGHGNGSGNGSGSGDGSGNGPGNGPGNDPGNGPGNGPDNNPGNGPDNGPGSGPDNGPGNGPGDGNGPGNGDGNGPGNGNGNGNGDGNGNNPPGSSGPDPFDELPPARQQELIDEVIGDSNPDFPTSRANAEALLRGGPPGTTPQVAGPGVQGADIRFVDENGNTVLARENKSITGGSSSFGQEVKHAALEQLNREGEIWVQVPRGTTATDVYNMTRGFQGARPRLTAYEKIELIFRDPDGNVLGQFNLGTKLPPRFGGGG